MLTAAAAGEPLWTKEPNTACRSPTQVTGSQALGPSDVHQQEARVETIWDASIQGEGAPAQLLPVDF